MAPAPKPKAPAAKASVKAKAAAPRGKKYPKTRTIERQGIALIATWVTGMGYIWNETQVDVGIDGLIELVDPATEESTGRTILVQSKATGFPFVADGEITYVCREEDIRYWLHGNAPVILVRSHPSSGEAYWKSIKDYFADNPGQRASKISYGNPTATFGHGPVADGA